MNYKNLIVFSFMIFLLSLLFGCSEKLSDEEIKQKLIAANSDLNSYRYNLSIIMDIMTNVEGQETNIKSETKFNGNVDRNNKKMSIFGTIKSDLIVFKTEPYFEAYIVDDFIYTKRLGLGNWIKTKSDEDIWTQHDNIGQTIELIQSGTIERLDDETLDGNSYYVVKSNPDFKKLVESIMEQQLQSELLSEDMDFEDIVKEYSAEIWINKETFVIERAKSNILLSMTPENAGIENARDMRGEVDLRMSTDLKIGGINRKVTINLPDDATNAPDMTELIKGIEPERFLHAKCTLPAGIACTDFRIDSAAGVLGADNIPNGRISVVLRNGLGFDIDTITVAASGCPGVAGNPTMLRNGDSGTFDLDCNDDDSDPEENLVSDRRYNGDLNVTYTNVDTQLTHRLVGSIIGRAEMWQDKEKVSTSITGNAIAEVFGKT